MIGGMLFTYAHYHRSSYLPTLSCQECHAFTSIAQDMSPQAQNRENPIFDLKAATPQTTSFDDSMGHRPRTFLTYIPKLSLARSSTSG